MVVAFKIPPTDVECQWDWRSFRCESACHCAFQFRSGDYHLGRSCRRRRADDELAVVVCEPTVFLLDKPVPRRIVSLIRQTTGILRGKVVRSVENIIQAAARQLTRAQDRICSELRSRLQENSAETTGSSSSSMCWSSVPDTTIWERLFCGRIIDLPLCNNKDVEYEYNDGPLLLRRTDHAVLIATTTTTTTSVNAKKLVERRKERMFAEFYEKDF
jgi:hypothetical protein